MEPDPGNAEPPVACDTCGRDAVVVVDGKGWCESCLHARGSCCAESEMEDG